MMANIGTEINAIIVDQGFDYAEFDAASLVSKKTGLQFMARFEKNASGIGRRHVWVNIDRTVNGAYDIKFGLGANDTIAKSVGEADLGATLIAILRKEKSRA